MRVEPGCQSQWEELVTCTKWLNGFVVALAQAQQTDVALQHITMGNGGLGLGPGQPYIVDRFAEVHAPQGGTNQGQPRVAGELFLRL